MMQTIRFALAGLVVVVTIATNALAQFPNRPMVPANRPTFSPYLNLTRPGNLGVNYYGIVRPELEFRNNIQNLQQQMTGVEQSLGGGNTAAAGGLPDTGHSVSFGNLSHYFGNNPASPRGVGGSRPNVGGQFRGPMSGNPTLGLMAGRGAAVGGGRPSIPGR